MLESHLWQHTKVWDVGITPLGCWNPQLCAQVNNSEIEDCVKYREFIGCGFSGNWHASVEKPLPVCGEAFASVKKNVPACL